MAYTKCIFEALFVMMRKILFFLLLIAGIGFSHGQSRTIDIRWEQPIKKTATDQGPKSQSLQKRALEQLSLKLEADELSYTSVWKDRGYARPNSLQVTEVRYAPLTKAEQVKVNASLVPNSVQASVSSSKARDEIYTQFLLSPVVRVNGALRKVVSAKIDYDYGPQPAANRQPVSNSVLASGNWFRFKVEETGVYRLSRGFLEDLGLDLSGSNPRNIRIHGHGGKPLPLYNGIPVSFDPPEVAIQVVGEEDGQFDGSDYILFYGVGPYGYDLENDTHINPYDEEAYYYITIGESPGLRVQPLVQPTGIANRTIDTFNDYAYQESDEFSPAKVGRRWVGNRFDINGEQSYEFNFENAVSGALMEVTVKAAATAEIPTSMAISVNGTSIDPITFGVINDPVLMSYSEAVADVPSSGQTVTVDLTYNNGGNPTSVGYLDYIRINALRTLSGTGNQIAFTNEAAAGESGIGQYEFSNASDYVAIWDVTDPAQIGAIGNPDGEASLSFKANLGSQRKYVALHGSNFLQPQRAPTDRLNNQNLKGSIFDGASGSFEDLDYLIVTAPFLLQPALRLAAHHQAINGLNVKVVTTDMIYNEFSTGQVDITAIRNFVRYIYDNASSPDKRLKYLCLFGDTSIDFKDRLSNNNNIVPTFHTLQSTSTFSSYMSDDFFGNLDPDEGTIGSESLDEDGDRLNDNDRLDLAVGRILADDVLLANRMVDKVIDYADKASYGNWRNSFLLISDDVDAVYEYSTLEVTLDEIGDNITAAKPYINVKKIHSDAFQQEASAGGDRYPEVNEAINNGMEVGALIVNYFGHGGEDGLAKEFIFTKGMAEDFKNQNRYPCFVTVTCEFTKFDNPQRITAGELTYWNYEGGAVSLITTTRSIAVTLGVQFNEVLAEELFGFGQVIPEAPAEALRISKNQIGDRNRRVIFYIGDPAMHLAFPKQQVVLTSVNGGPINGNTPVLKALDRVTLGGEVRDEAGNLLSGYNGVVEVKLYDKNEDRSTLGNDGIRDAPISEGGELLILDFVTLGEILFNGQATVSNGRFEVEFVLPRDTRIPVGNGKVSLYGNRNVVLEDQTGFNLDVRIGGLNETAPADNIGPEVQLFMNDESFVTGGITNDSPVLIVKLEDENGINTASGIGHDMVAILDGDETKPFVLNEYYQADVDDFSKGVARYKFRNLEEGVHTLSLKAWDVYNNSTTTEIQFVVYGDDVLEIRRVLNYPNPFVDYTEFWFQHNRPNEVLDVQVQIFTVSGKVVRTINQTVVSEGSLSRSITWDGRDDFGDKIGKGVYVYKLTVQSSLADQRVEKFEKLVIL